MKNPIAKNLSQSNISSKWEKLQIKNKVWEFWVDGKKGQGKMERKNAGATNCKRMPDLKSKKNSRNISLRQSEARVKDSKGIANYKRRKKWKKKTRKQWSDSNKMLS